MGADWYGQKPRHRPKANFVFLDKKCKIRDGQEIGKPEKKESNIYRGIPESCKGCHSIMMVA